MLHADCLIFLRHMVKMAHFVSINSFGSYTLPRGVPYKLENPLLFDTFAALHFSFPKGQPSDLRIINCW